MAVVRSPFSKAELQTETSSDTLYAFTLKLTIINAIETLINVTCEIYFMLNYYLSYLKRVSCNPEFISDAAGL